LLNITDRKKTDCEQNIYNAQVGYVHGTAVVLYFLVYYKKKLKIYLLKTNK
jgi:hypothetical protein